jgi:hypothetical protein
MDYPHFFVLAKLFVVHQSFGYARFQRPQSPYQQNQEKTSGTPIHRNHKWMSGGLKCFEPLGNISFEFGNWDNVIAN